MVPVHLEQSLGSNSALVREVVAEIVLAIGHEMLAVNSDPNSTIDVRDGKKVGEIGGETLWAFECDGQVPVLSDTPGVLHVPGLEPLEVSLVAVGDLDVIIGVRDDLGDAVADARLSLEPWFIYDRLRGRLEDASSSEWPTDLAEALLDVADFVDPQLDFSQAESSPEPKSAQEAAVDNASRTGLRFVWGPPGTGKTRALAATVKTIAYRGDTVLVVAHSNAAVDIAMVQVAEQLEGTSLLTNGQVLRIGTPQSDAARACKAIQPDEHIRARQPELVDERDRLELERRRVGMQLKAAHGSANQGALSERLGVLRSAIAELQQRIREARVALVNNARVLGMTLSKVVLDDLFWKWPADHMIVDEASMAGVPFVLGLALQNPNGLACFGDFRQLPPIAVSNRDEVQQWFARDVFEIAGVVARIEAGEPDDRLSTLTTQYRMGEQISDVVGEFAYFNMLRTDESAATRAAVTARIVPGPGAEIVLVDTSSIDTACLREAADRSFSRFNPLSAALCVTLANGMLLNGAENIGVISPYRAQARLLASLLRDENRVTAATAHRFQGSERDIVILDLTDAEPQEGASRLTGRDDDLTMRLLNVSVSRARGKLVVVGDLDFLSRYHALSSQTRRLVELLQRSAHAASAADLLDTSGETMWADTWFDAVTTNSPALESARVVDVSIPGNEFDGTWLDDLVNTGHESVRLRAPLQVVRRFADATAEVHLKALAGAPILFVDDHTTVCGGRTLHSPAFTFTSAAVSAVLRRFLIASG